jgi:hypothetical protein
VGSVGTQASTQGGAHVLFDGLVDLPAPLTVHRVASDMVQHKQGLCSLGTQLVRHVLLVPNAHTTTGDSVTCHDLETHKSRAADYTHAHT